MQIPNNIAAAVHTATNNTCLITTINSLENTARIPALRRVCNSMLAKTIGAVRQHIRDRKREERDAESGDYSLDERNQYDEDVRGEIDAALAMGFTRREAPIVEASRYNAVREAAASELQTLAHTRYDEPMEVEAMLDFMIGNSRPLDTELVKALAKAAKVDPKYIIQMDEVNQQNERKQLTEMRSEIISTIKGFGGRTETKITLNWGTDGVIDAVDALPKVAQHQLAVKVVDGLHRAKDNVVQRALKTRRISDLGSLALLDEGIERVSEVVNFLERRYKAELEEAEQAGRTVLTLDDLVTA